MNIIPTTAANINADYSDTGLRRTLKAYLGYFAKDFDTDAIIADWRKAIDEALPAGLDIAEVGVIQTGDYDASLDEIIEAVESVDLDEIIGRHDKTAR